jgi:hypothetical protein
MLSQDMTVNGGMPARRRRSRASTTYPNTVEGVAPGLQVGDHPGVVGDEFAGGLVEVVAALGDGQGDDAGLGPGQRFEDALRIVGGVEVVDDRADHPGFEGAVRVFGDEGVLAVLRVERVGHGLVAGHDADAADAPRHRRPWFIRVSM